MRGLATRALLARMRVSALLLAASAASPAFAQTTASEQQQRAIAQFAEQLAADVRADSIGAISAAVVLNGKLHWSRGFGWADRDQKKPATAETIYRVGSISKSFTAVALMRAFEQGKVALDEPLQKYLPEAAGFANPRAEAKPPTLRQFASHTAGLIREPALPNAAAGPIAQWEAKVLASIPATRFDTVPGARYQYSNIGFGVLGLALSRAVGIPFMTFVESQIFQPLQMRSSTFIIDERLRPQLAVGYANRPNGTIDATAPAAEHDGRGYKVPNGGIYSTVGDLAKFMAMMMGSAGDAVLSMSTRSEMMRVQTPGNGRSGYGLGFDISTAADGTRVVGHGGSVAGYTAYLAFDPERRVGVILLRNYASGRTNLNRAASNLLRELARVHPEF
jgi:CubicO group peptidase (beta-lactamase class C family)